MGLSSNILWHQTDIDGLKHILQERRIRCSYSTETILWRHNKELVMAFPIISFCDIPFADIADYLSKYGMYCIGFKNTCLRRWGVCPVWYRSKESNILKVQMDAWKAIKNKPIEEFSEADKLLWVVVAHTKNTTGKLRKYNFESYCFYDEREIRWCPSWNDLMSQNLEPFMSTEQYNAKRTLKKPLFAGELQLDFTIKKDIAYIIIPTPNVRGMVMELLDGTNDIPILTKDQVVQDIIGVGHNKYI